MRDPLLNCMALGGADNRLIHVDPERVQIDEFEAAAVLTGIIWGPEGFAEMLGPTWAMVHDPRFVKIEREAVIYKRSMSGAVTAQGPSLIQALDLVSKIEVIDDLTIYSEMLGEGRHFLTAARAKGIDPHTLQDDDPTIWDLIADECSNYRRRDGSWNDEAHRLHRMIRAGVVGLIADYAEIAYSQDWIRMDNETVVAAGSRVLGDEGDMDAPTVAVEVDTLQRALTMRAQVRLTALRVLKQFPGVKPEELEALVLTDDEADQLCQILFKAETLDKLYTVMPEVLNLVRYAQVVPYDERVRETCERLQKTSQEFCAKLASGEIQPITTDEESEGEDGPDVAQFVLSLMGDEQKRTRFEALQMFEADEDPEAVELVQALMASNGSDEVWDRCVAYLTRKHGEMLAQRQKDQIQTALDAPAPVESEELPREVTTVEGSL